MCAFKESGGRIRYINKGKLERGGRRHRSSEIMKCRREMATWELERLSIIGEINPEARIALWR